MELKGSNKDYYEKKRLTHFAGNNPKRERFVFIFEHPKHQVPTPTNFSLK